MSRQTKSAGFCDSAAPAARAAGPERSDRLSNVTPYHAFPPVKGGQTTEARFELPINRGLEDATLGVTVDGPGFKLNSMWAMTLPAASRKDGCTKTDPPRVSYSPPGEGSHRGRLVFTARWADGHTERQVVELTGSSAIVSSNSALGNSTPLHRITQLQPVTVGEQIVGSRHEFPIEPPANLSDEAGFAAVYVEGDAQLGAAWGTLGQVVDLEPGKPAPPIRITYAPKQPGSHVGLLQLVAHWPDKHVERQSVAVTASARRETDAPAQHAPPVSPPAAPGDRSYRDKPMTVGQDEDVRALGLAVEGMFDHQAIGVQTVEKEQAKYKSPPAPRPLWLDLAELAITLGTDGLTKLAERFIKQRLADSLGLLVKAAAGAAAAPDRSRQLTLFGLDDLTHTDIKEKSAEVDPTSTAGSLVTGLFSGMKSAVTTAAKAKIQPDPAAEPQHDSEGNSKDTAIDFFAEQSKLVSRASTEAQTAVSATFAGLMQLDKIHAGLSALVVAEMKNAAPAVAKQAQQEQMRHTSAQWLAARSRVTLGVETVGNQKVTKLDRARAFDKLAAPESAKGLLDIHVGIKDGRQWVSGASVRGISRMVAQRMLGVNLRAEHMPIRIVINDGQAYVTRDEAGRVRFSGYVHLDPDGKPGTVVDEKQELRTAQLIADHVLAKTLGQWGVNAVGTDDASQD